jgi:hypothetical protein
MPETAETALYKAMTKFFNEATKTLEKYNEVFDVSLAQASRIMKQVDKQ